MIASEAATEGVLKNFEKLTGKRVCQSLCFNKFADLRPTLLKKRLFSCDFYEISKNEFYYRKPLVAASGKIFKKNL